MKINRPKSIDAATMELQRGDRKILAGGTDLLDLLHGTRQHVQLVSLDNILELNNIELKKGRIEVGANITLSELAESEHLAHHTGLVQALTSLATPQIRNIATVAGNVLQDYKCCRYRQCNCTDNEGVCNCIHPSTLGMIFLAYGASIGFSDETTMTIKDLYKNQGEHKPHNLTSEKIVTKVVIPQISKRARSKYVRIMQRNAAEWPAVECFGLYKLEKDCIAEVALGLGGVGNHPIKLSNLEKELIGKDINFIQESEEIENYLDLLSSSNFPQYKVPLVKQAVKDIFN